MDFDRLPSDILFTVLQRLPFKERIRIACVNRRFKDISEMAISQTKALSLTAPIFRNANTESMSKLIQFCAPNLKELICEFPHPTHIEYHSTILERLKFLMKYPHPWLEVLKIYTKFFNDAEALQQLLASLPNLRTVEWKDPPSEFPKTVCKNVECAIFRQASIDFVASMGDYCPNVKHVVFDRLSIDDQDEHGLNGALAKWPALETVELRERSKYVIKQEIAALKNLKQLRIFKFEYLTKAIVLLCTALDRSVEELANCESLEIVELDRWHVSPDILMALAHRCPKLRRLQVEDISINPPLALLAHPQFQSEVESFVQSLDGFVQEDLTINLTRPILELWQCAEVQSAIARIQSPNHKLSFTFERGCHSQNNNGSDRINEWDKDPCCHCEKPVKPMKSFGQRFIDAIWNLPSKLFNVLK